MKPTIALLAGTRPEWIRLAPVARALGGAVDIEWWDSSQQQDPAMSERIRRDLKLPPAEWRHTPGERRGMAFLASLLEGLLYPLRMRRPAALVVRGDTWTALGGAIAAAKLNIPLWHVEAGTRSGDRFQTEEQNRIVIDHLADWNLAPGEAQAAALEREGISPDRITVYPGMLAWPLGYAGDIFPPVPDKIESPTGRVPVPPTFGLVTLHRYELVNSPGALRAALEEIAEAIPHFPWFWPVHPRAADRLGKAKLPPNILEIRPLGWLETLGLAQRARVVATDSGGLQVEAALLGTPTVVVRSASEWDDLIQQSSHVQIAAPGTGQLGPALRDARDLERAPRAPGEHPPKDIVDEAFRRLAEPRPRVGGLLPKDEPFS